MRESAKLEIQNSSCYYCVSLNSGLASNFHLAIRKLHVSSPSSAFAPLTVHTAECTPRTCNAPNLLDQNCYSPTLQRPRLPCSSTLYVASFH